MWEKRLSIFLGSLFLGFALTGIFWLGLPVVFSEARQEVIQGSKSQEAKQVEKVGFADYLNQDPLVAHLQPESRDFGLVIPKIGVNSRVIANVDANNKTEYMAALKQGLAQAKGSALPGEKGDIFIFGHSTDVAWRIEEWNALFYSLKDLEVGDKVYVYYKDSPRIYVVSDKSIYGPKDLSFLNQNGNQEKLLLQTCWPPGTSLKRLIITAKPLGPIDLTKEV